jgi:DUF917 family protein
MKRYCIVLSKWHGAGLNQGASISWGRRVSVIALLAPPVFLTAAGLDHIGPRAFGYDLEFRLRIQVRPGIAAAL